MPSNTDEKSGDFVAKALQFEHPDVRTADMSQLPAYAGTPDFVNLDIMDEIIEKVAQQLSRSVGVGGSDSHTLTHWLLRFGTASGQALSGAC
jgi:hypothetical protein